MTTKRPLQEGYHKTEDGKWEIIANHEIHGVTPEMIDWWWDHIDTTERYKLWHPTDHVSFVWLVSPATNGHVGAVQRIVEFLNGIPATPVALEIRWEDAKEANGHGIRARRSKNGAVSFDVLETEAAHAPVQ